jgi:hypothetical protein
MRHSDVSTLLVVQFDPRVVEPAQGRATAHLAAVLREIAPSMANVGCYSCSDAGLFFVTYLGTLFFRHLMQGGRTSVVITFMLVLPGLLGGLLGFVWGQIATHMLRPYFAKERPGVCRACGYDLTANVSGVCPECGTAVVGESKKNL